jgi:hypothetical protein
VRRVERTFLLIQRRRSAYVTLNEQRRNPVAATSPQPRSTNNRNTLIGGILALLILVGVALLVLWLLDERREEGQGIVPGDQPNTVSEVLANPAVFYGENVIVSGSVVEIVGPMAFVITDPQWAGGEAELLVIAPPPPAIAQGTLEEDLYAEDVVQVTGVLHQYEPATIQQEIGADAPLQGLEEYQGRPVLVGEISALTPRMVTGEGGQVSVDDVLSNPSDYYDDRVTVSSGVSEVISEQAFVLEGGLLVIDASGELAETALQGAQDVQVSGLVREMQNTGVIAAEYGIELDHGQLAEYQGQPVLIGEVITIVR